TSPNHVSTTMNGKGYEPGGISGAGSALSESLARGVDRPRETTMKEPAMGADELGSLVDQAKRLIDLGVPESAQGALSGAELLAAATELTERSPAGSLLVVSESLLPASVLAPLMMLPGSPGADDSGPRGFVVEDMTDVDSFAPTGVDVPDAAVYALADPSRGD